MTQPKYQVKITCGKAGAAPVQLSALLDMQVTEIKPEIAIRIDAITASIPPEVKLESLCKAWDIEPMGVMCWDYSLNDIQFLALIARDILAPAIVKWGDTPPLENDQIPTGPFAIKRDRWVVTDQGVYVSEGDMANHDDAKWECGPRSVTWCNDEDLCELLGKLRGDW